MDDILKALELDKKGAITLAAENLSTIAEEELTELVNETLEDQSEPKKSNFWELVDYPDSKGQLEFLEEVGLLTDWLQEHYNVDMVLAIRESFGMEE